VGLGAAGQPLGGPSAAVVQLRVALLGEADVADHSDRGFGRATVALAGLQGGGVEYIPVPHQKPTTPAPTGT